MSIRNFVIIAHIDHGKSTLADRLLEYTATVESRRMRPQYLDQLDLERERGITIKMAPVRMGYSAKNGQRYILNLIDTPGHSDFSYEVSRALHAVEGAVLLVDAVRGIQAQTLSNLRLAQQAGLTVIGVINKIDVDPEAAENVAESVAELLGCATQEILRVSARTGQGIQDVLEAVIAKVPPPKIESESEKEKIESGTGGRALIFDSRYDDHKGILAYVRVIEGRYDLGRDATLVATNEKFKIKETGIFTPELKTFPQLTAGEIGYIATGLKDPRLVNIGDTIAYGSLAQKPLPGYRKVQPVVFIAFYPDGDTEFDDLKKGLEKLRLNDASLSFEPDNNEALGRGIKVGFLGQLHFEITSDRLMREFGLEFLTSFPSISYRIVEKGIERTITQTQDFPSHPDKVFAPMIRIEILTPPNYLQQVVSLNKLYEFEIAETKNVGNNVLITGVMPLSELIRDFDDQLKSVSAGFASFSYELSGEQIAEVKKMEILVAGAVQPALTRIIPAKEIEREGRITVERLKELLPAVQFSQALQAQVDGRIIARETIAAVKKELGNFGKNGGDRTRKMKLWKKQQEGKKRLKQTGRVTIPLSVFREILKK